MSSSPRSRSVARLAVLGLLVAASACASSQSIPLDSVDPRYADYLTQVRAQIKARWSYPCVDDRTTKRCEYHSARLLVEFGIATDGQVRYVQVRRSSGLPVYDASAMNAIMAAAPFPPVPPAMMAQMPPGSQGVAVSATFNYVVESRSP
jgi:TonB family protein